MSALLVFGSANMDVQTLVVRHPLPGETIKGKSTSYSLGGKGANQAMAASLSGAKVYFVGAVGKDSFGVEMIENLMKAGIDVNGTIRVDMHTGTAFITVDEKGENSIILSEGANRFLSMDVFYHYFTKLNDVSVVLLQNEIPWEATFHAAKYAYESGVSVWLNPAPIPEQDQLFEILPYIDLLIVNEWEAAYATGININDIGDAKQAALQLITRGVREVLITLGEKGSLWIAKDHDGIYTPAKKVNVVDTTAAGDTFIGILCTERLRACSMDSALKTASIGAALAITREGAQKSMPSRQELTDFIGKLKE